MKTALVVVIVVLIGVIGWRVHDARAVAENQAVSTVRAKSVPGPKALTSTPKATPCSSNSLQRDIVISISRRYLWACSGHMAIYDSPVVTGMAYLAADLTPTGTYHIFAKYTDRHLIGHDSTGSWNDFVHYWIPWLHNQYGNYGFHDATWRKASDFGNISPYSTDPKELPSHGCIELPLIVAKWLYGWAPIGTTVTIVS